MAQNPGIQATQIFQTPNPIVDRREVSRANLLTQVAHFLRLGSNGPRIQRLKEVLTLTEKEAVLSELDELGVQVDADLAAQDLQPLKEALAGFVREIERKSQIPTLTEDFNRQLSAVHDMEGGPRSTDVAPDDPRLNQLRADFDKGLFILEAKEAKVDPAGRAGASTGETPKLGRFAEALKLKQPTKSELTWEDVVERLNRLNPKNHEKTNLALVLAMEGGGELIGVSKGGQLLFKDREPTFCRGMDYWETYEAVYGPEDKPTGYQLFPQGKAQFEKPPVIGVYERIKGHFIEGVEEHEISTWLDNGRDSEKALSSVQTLDAKKVEVPTGIVYRDAPIPRSDVPAESPLPTVSVPFKSGRTTTSVVNTITSNLPSSKLPTRGAIRLLKI